MCQPITGAFSMLMRLAAYPISYDLSHRIRTLSVRPRAPTCLSPYAHKRNKLSASRALGSRSRRIVLRPSGDRRRALRESRALDVATAGRVPVALKALLARLVDQFAWRASLNRAALPGRYSGPLLRGSVSPCPIDKSTRRARTPCNGARPSSRSLKARPIARGIVAA